MQLVKKSLIRLLILLTAGFIGATVPGCDVTGDRILDISFMMNEQEGYPRSDQLVIWLEKPDNTFVKTLYVSEYLSYGGYNDPEICPDWSSNTNWEEASEEEFDAVTAATPSIGPVHMEIPLTGDQVPKGEYIVYVEIHLTADYNELYSGGIRFSRKEESSLLEVSYKPERYHDATYDVLSDVRITVH